MGHQGQNVDLVGQTKGGNQEGELSGYMHHQKEGFAIKMVEVRVVEGQSFNLPCHVAVPASIDSKVTI